MLVKLWGKLGDPSWWRLLPKQGLGSPDWPYIIHEFGAPTLRSSLSTHRGFIRTTVPSCVIWRQIRWELLAPRLSTNRGLFPRYNGARDPISWCAKKVKKARKQYLCVPDNDIELRGVCDAVHNWNTSCQVPAPVTNFPKCKTKYQTHDSTYCSGRCIP